VTTWAGITVFMCESIAFMRDFKWMSTHYDIISLGYRVAFFINSIQQIQQVD